LDKAERAALRLIARAEQCSNGITRKLERRGCDKDSIREVVSRLCELDLINDSRYARLWLQSRLRFARSPMRLLSSLCARGIDHDDAQTALNTVLDEDAELVMLAKYIKKYGKNKTQPIKFILKSEGFSTTSIKKYFNEE